MKALRLIACLCVSVLFVGAASPALGLANRVFVSARSGNNANACDNISTPCQTFAGAVTQLNPGGEAIVLDSGGYGPVTITQSVTIEAPPGVLAFIHPPSGDAITINAGSSDKVTLRGLTLNGGTSGIMVNSVGTLRVEDCAMAGLSSTGIDMTAPGSLFVKRTDISSSLYGVHVGNATGAAQVSLDHCHLDGNQNGYFAATTAPGSSATTAANTTANNNGVNGWTIGNSTSGKDVLTLEFCTGSDNAVDGLTGISSNAQSVARYSNCAFTGNAVFGVERFAPGIIESRGNNTIRGNSAGQTSGTIATFVPL